MQDCGVFSHETSQGGQQAHQDKAFHLPSGMSRTGQLWSGGGLVNTIRTTCFRG